MKRSIVFILCIGLLCGFTNSPTGYKLQSDKAAVFSPVSSGTDFTKDANCMGAWYENSASGSDELDRTSNGNNLSDLNGVAVSTTVLPSGYSGKSKLYVAGNGECHYIADGTELDVNGANQAISLSMWIRFTFVTSNNSTLICKGDLTLGTQYRVYVVGTSDGTNPRKVAFALTSSGTTETTAYSNTSIYQDNWYHVVCVYDDTDMRIYVNGVLDSNGTSNPKTYSDGIANSAYNFVLGRSMNNGSSSSGLNGYLDEIAVFNKAITSSQVSTIYSKGISANKGGSD